MDTADLGPAMSLSYAERQGKEAKTEVAALRKEVEELRKEIEGMKSAIRLLAPGFFR